MCCGALFRLYKVHEESGKPFELEMSWICEESGWKHARVSGGGNTNGVLCAGCCCRALQHSRWVARSADQGTGRNPNCTSPLRSLHARPKFAATCMPPVCGDFSDVCAACFSLLAAMLV
eukprot:GHRQ01013435.1.p2 GENE.GHRQ01013435.1~~GHRQ01013435.1.p2  ORF type:complete len:119 (+),score=4.62 GHRQ01013435.1:660-1016(+)